MLVLTELECMIFVYPNMQLFKWKKWFYLSFPLHLILPGFYHLLIRYSAACRRCSGTDTCTDRIGMYDFCISHHAIIRMEEMILSGISCISDKKWLLWNPRNVAKMHFTLSTAGLESFYKGIPLLITYILSYYIQNELWNTKTTSVPGREKIRLW